MPGIRRIADALDEFCANERVPDETAWRLRVAVDEIVANIVKYGAIAAPCEIEVAFRRHGDVVEIAVADSGPAFDPLSRPPPDVTLPLELRRPGGLGIALVRALMDDVSYERTGRNILTIRKRISADAGGADGNP